MTKDVDKTLETQVVCVTILIRVGARIRVREARVARGWLEVSAPLPSPVYLQLVGELLQWRQWRHWLILMSHQF